MFEDFTRKVGAGIVAGAAVMSASGCAIPQKPAPAVETDLGDGVFQLPAATWPESLATFRKHHPGLKVIDTELATTNHHGVPTSFVVVTEPLAARPAGED